MNGRHTTDPSTSRPGLARTGALLVAFLAIGWLACSAPAPAPPLPETPALYRVGTPDRLQVVIQPDPLIQRDVTVRPDGKISVDLIGDVQASGRTLVEIAEEIEKRISRFKLEPRATVSLAQAASTEVTLLGQVARPTTLTLSKQTRVVEAIGSVGGPTRFASKGSIRVIRFDNERVQVIPVDFGAIERGDLRTNILLNGGDIIVIPPNVLARVGFAFNILFFPVQQLLGAGGRVVAGGL